MLRRLALVDSGLNVFVKEVLFKCGFSVSNFSSFSYNLSDIRCGYINMYPIFSHLA